MSLLIKLIESPWFWLDVVLSVLGGILVWRGLKIEKDAEKLLPPENFKSDIFGDIVEKYKAEIERGWRILMRGVIIEVVAALGISIISGLEIAELNAKAEQAEETAGKANVLASSNEVQVAIFSIKLIELAHQYDLSTNALAEADHRLLEASNTAARAEQAVNNANIAILQNLNRHLSYDQKVKLLNVISPYPTLKFAFFLEDTVPDAKGLAVDLSGVFAYDGWTQEQAQGGMMPMGEGVFFWSDKANDATIKAIAGAMTSFGLNGQAVDRSSGFGVSLSNLVFVVIGHKPEQ